MTTLSVSAERRAAEDTVTSLAEGVTMSSFKVLDARTRRCRTVRQSMWRRWQRRCLIISVLQARDDPCRVPLLLLFHYLSCSGSPQLVARGGRCVTATGVLQMFSCRPT